MRRLVYYAGGGQGLPHGSLEGECRRGDDELHFLVHFWATLAAISGCRFFCQLKSFFGPTDEQTVFEPSAALCQSRINSEPTQQMASEVGSERPSKLLIFLFICLIAALVVLRGDQVIELLSFPWATTQQVQATFRWTVVSTVEWRPKAHESSTSARWSSCCPSLLPPSFARW